MGFTSRSIFFLGLDIIISYNLSLWDSACQCSSLFSFSCWGPERSCLTLTSHYSSLQSVLFLYFSLTSESSQSNGLPGCHSSLAPLDWHLPFFLFLISLSFFLNLFSITHCSGHLQFFPKNHALCLVTFKNAVKISSYASWSFISWLPKSFLHLPKLSSLSPNTE